MVKGFFSFAAEAMGAARFSDAARNRRPQSP
jgi:hypothetical protein